MYIIGSFNTITECSAWLTNPLFLSTSGGCSLSIPCCFISLNANSVVGFPNILYRLVEQNGSPLYFFISFSTFLESGLLSGFSFISVNIVAFPDSYTTPAPFVANGSIAMIMPSSSTESFSILMFGIDGFACISYLSKPCPDKFIIDENPFFVITSCIFAPISLIFMPGFIIFSASFSASLLASTNSLLFPKS